VRVDGRAPLGEQQAPLLQRVRAQVLGGGEGVGAVQLSVSQVVGHVRKWQGLDWD